VKEWKRSLKMNTNLWHTYMRGVSKKIILNAEFGGITKDPWGNTRTGFSVTGKINSRILE
jgi:hypothetical protein